MTNTIYSPRQIFWCTLFGGPFALTYLLIKNFEVLERPSEAQQVILLGLSLSLVLLLLMVFIPVNISTPVFIVCAFAGERIARAKQFQKPHILEGATFQSTWRVILVSFISLLVWAAIALLTVAGLHMAGVVTNV